MAARRAAGKRRFGRRPRKGSGRQGLWIRQPSYSPTLVEASTATYSDIVLDPSMWERAEQVGTQPKKGAGGAMLERLFCQFSFIVTFDADSAGSFVIPSAECLCSMQSDQFANVIVGTTTFNASLENERVLWHEEYARTDSSFRESAGGAFVGQVQYSGKFESKMKARLADRAVTQSWTLGFDTAGTGISNVSQTAVWTAYMTTP